MIESRKRVAWVVYLASLYALLICCEGWSQSDTPPEEAKPSAAVEMPDEQPSEPQEVQETEPDPQEVPVAEDFEGEVEATVNEDNYLTELERLEKEIEHE